MPQFKFQDASLSFDERVNALLEELTLDEKLLLITCRQQAIPRLGIKAFTIGTEAARGLLCRSDEHGEEPATVFPESFGLAATFDSDIMRSLGDIAAREAEYYNRLGRSSLCLWAPTVDLERDPRWGRTEEGYGEDPLLTGKLAAAYTKGMYGTDEKYARAIPTLKHFYANNHEEDRTSDNASVPIVLKHDYYLKAFELPMKKGGARSLMTSYNQINGVEAMCNPELSEYCKRDWGMLFSVTDGWDLIGNVTRRKTDDTHAEAIARVYKNQGADIINDEQDVAEAAAREALELGTISESDIDRALFGALKARFLLGEFDDRPRDSAALREPCAPESLKTALKAAEESIILLKNKHSVLPLNKKERVSIIGVHADMNFRDWYTGYSERNPTILDAVIALVGRENVNYESGNDVIALRNAENGFYFSVGENGEFVCDTPLINECCLLELFEWGGGAVSLKSKYNGKFLCDCGTVKCVSDEPYGWCVKEKFTIVKKGNDYILKNWQDRFLHITDSGEIAVTEKIKPKSSSLFDIEVFSSGVDKVRRAVTESHNAVVFCGNNPIIGARECFDRRDLELPENQKKLAEEVLALNENAVMVLVSGFPYAVNDEFSSVVHTPHAGPSMGTAVAKTLFGDISPAGRCPVTWYSSDSELGSIKDYNIIRTESTYRYYCGKPLFPFGHGLSYTAFRYGALKLNKTAFNRDERVEVTFEVKNVGGRASDEVVQIYAAAPRFSSAVPIKELRAFRRIHIPAEESCVLTLSFDVDDLKLWDIGTNRFEVYSGVYEIQVGGSSADIFRTAEITVSAADYPGLDVTKSVPAAAAWEYTGVEFRTDKRLNEYALLFDWQSGIVYENCRLNGESKIELVVSNPSSKTTFSIICAETGATVAEIDVPQTGSLTRFTEIVSDAVPLCGNYTLKMRSGGMLSLKSFRFFK